MSSQICFIHSPFITITFCAVVYLPAHVCWPKFWQIYRELQLVCDIDKVEKKSINPIYLSWSYLLIYITALSFIFCFMFTSRIFLCYRCAVSFPNLRQIHYVFNSVFRLITKRAKFPIIRHVWVYSSPNVSITQSGRQLTISILELCENLCR